MKFLREMLDVECLICGEEDCRKCKILLVDDAEAWQRD